MRNPRTSPPKNLEKTTSVLCHPTQLSRTKGVSGGKKNSIHSTIYYIFGFWVHVGCWWAPQRGYLTLQDHIPQGAPNIQTASVSLDAVGLQRGLGDETLTHIIIRCGWLPGLVVPMHPISPRHPARLSRIVSDIRSLRIYKKKNHNYQCLADSEKNLFVKVSCVIAYRVQDYA